jgi:hypothetical protein
VHRILRVIAEPIGRAETIGRPWLWRLRNPTLHNLGIMHKNIDIDSTSCF